MRSIDDREPTQAIPARTVAIYSFTCNDIYVGFTRVALSTCASRFADLLRQRANAFGPKRFVAVPTLEPWPNCLILSGFITNAAATTSTTGKCSVQLPMTMDLGMADPGQGVETILDTHQDVAKGNVNNPPLDTNGFFDAITPILSKYFDELLADFANNSQFNEYPWDTTVTAVDSATSITIGAGANSNIQVGNLLKILRFDGKSYSPVALVEVTLVSDETAKCFYYGAGNQAALVQDGVFVANVKKQELEHAREGNEDTESSPNVMFTVTDAAVHDRGARALLSSSGPFTSGVQIILSNGALTGSKGIIMDGSLMSVVSWLYAEIWMYDDVAGGAPAQVPSVVLTIEAFGPNSPWNIDLPLTLVKVDQVPTIFPPPEIGLVDHYLGSMPINFNLGPGKTALVTFSRNSAIRSSAVKVMFVGNKQ